MSCPPHCSLELGPADLMDPRGFHIGRKVDTVSVFGTFRILIFTPLNCQLQIFANSSANTIYQNVRVNSSDPELVEHH